jgi:hypothetical protein
MNSVMSLCKCFKYIAVFEGDELGDVMVWSESLVDCSPGLKLTLG